MSDVTHRPCCSAHGEPMTCEKYRGTHFVEVRPCCAIDAATLADEATSEAVDELFCPICGRPEHGFCLGGAL